MLGNLGMWTQNGYMTAGHLNLVLPTSEIPETREELAIILERHIMRDQHY